MLIFGTETNIYIYFKIIHFHWTGMLTLNVENIKPLGTTEISMLVLNSIYTENVYRNKN